MPRVPNKLVNQWTPLHLLAGFVAAERGLSAAQTLGWSIAIEIVENVALRNTSKKTVLSESIGANNMIMDTVFNMAGYFASKSISTKEES